MGEKRKRGAFSSITGNVAFILISVLLAGALAGTSFYLHQTTSSRPLATITGTLEEKGRHIFFTITGEEGNLNWQDLKFCAYVNGQKVAVMAPQGGSVKVGQHVMILTNKTNGSLEVKIVDVKDNRLIYENTFSFHVSLPGKMMFEKNCTGPKMHKGAEMHKCTRNGAGKNSTRCGCHRGGQKCQCGHEHMQKRKGGCQGCQMQRRKNPRAEKTRTFKAWNPNNVQRRTFKGWNWRNERVRERQSWDYYFFLFFYFHSSWEVTYNHRSYEGSFTAWFLFYAIWKRNLLSFKIPL